MKVNSSGTNSTVTFSEGKLSKAECDQLKWDLVIPSCGFYSGDRAVLAKNNPYDLYHDVSPTPVIAPDECTLVLAFDLQERQHGQKLSPQPAVPRGYGS